MNSRRLVPTVLAAATLASAALLAVGASAAPCYSFEDPADDSRIVAPVTASTIDSDPNFDITGVTYKIDAQNYTVVVQVKQLGERGPAKGTTDLFEVYQRVKNKTVLIASYRHNPEQIGTALDAQYDRVLLRIDNRELDPPATVNVAYDTAADTITFVVKLDDLKRGLGPDLIGQAVTNLNVDGYLVVGAYKTVFEYHDRAYAGIETFPIAPCGDAAPLPSASGVLPTTPSTPGVTELDGIPIPEADCTTWSDAAGDASATGSTLATPVPTTEDSAVDITGVAVGVKQGYLIFSIRIPQLSGSGRYGLGPRFDMQFTVEGPTPSTTAVNFLMVTATPHSLYTEINSKQATPAQFPFVYVHGVAAGTARVDRNSGLLAVVDTTSKTVRFALPISYVNGIVPVDLVPGAQIRASGTYTRALGTTAASPGWNDAQYGDRMLDFVPYASPVIPFYTIGNRDECFPPPASQLSALGGLSVQYGDHATLSAKLTLEEDSTPVAGKQVTFSIPGASETGTTDSNGVARVSLAHGKTAGSYPVTVSFGGDGDADASSTSGTLVVAPEKTITSAKAARGAGTARTVTATVKDDDGKPVAGQLVNFYVNGRKAGSVRTTAAGTAVFKGARAGQTVYAEFPKVTNRYHQSKSPATRV